MQHISLGDKEKLRDAVPRLLARLRGDCSELLTSDIHNVVASAVNVQFAFVGPARACNCWAMWIQVIAAPRGMPFSNLSQLIEQNPALVDVLLASMAAIMKLGMEDLRTSVMCDLLDQAESGTDMQALYLQCAHLLYCANQLNEVDVPAFGACFSSLPSIGTELASFLAWCDQESTLHIEVLWKRHRLQFRGQA